MRHLILHKMKCLSISSMFNNQAFFDRQKEINKMRADGFNFDSYQNEKGELDYNRIAQDTGLIKSNGEVRQERNDMLAERRAYSQDVWIEAQDLQHLQVWVLQ